LIKKYDLLQAKLKLKMTAIDIVLPYYNGSAFIEEQIASILNSDLEGIDLKIILVNDASTPSETAFIKQFLKPNHLYLENEVNLGVIKSVERGLKYSTAPYVMLCDHDDVWLPDKIRKSLLKLIDNEQNSIALVYSDLIVSGPKLEKIHSSMMTYSGYCEEKAYPSILYQNIVTGCTVIMNRKLVEFALPFPLEVPMHDHWLAVCAVFAGKIHLLKEPTILYRQHGKNQIGAASKTLFAKIWNMKTTIVGFQNHLRLKKHMAQALCQRLKEHDFNSESLVVKNISQALVNRDVLYLLKNKVLRGGFVRVLGNILLLTFIKIRDS
jgi:glycosyltransferase involved in cell wall biosynthesis